MNNYIKALENSLKRDHTEMTHRSDLKRLLTDLLHGYTITEEPGSKKGNKPDYEISKGKTPIGFIETKKVDYDLNKLEKDDQLKRYFESIGNVITTDYLEFRWYIKTENTNSYSNGKLVPQLTVRIADNISGKLRIKENAENNLKQLLKDFTETKVATVKKAKDLASRMSSIAKMIKDSIHAELTADNDIFSNSTGENQLAKQLEFFKDNLITGLGEIEFADMYAQTICYGLFSAKIELGAKELLWESAWKVIPKTNPFLKKLFSEFTQELPESVTKSIDLAVHLLNKSDLESVLLDFGKGSSRDPVFHFYETFLGEYNPKLKEKRGVYYTPEPVVGFIVRSVNELLKDKFNMPEGLGDSSDTVVKRKTEDGKEEQYTTKRLHILDPATGTGTFLYHTLKQIFEERRIDKGNPKKTETLLERDILPRIHGFELMMAPYTIAHMKLGNLLHDVGYEGEQRLNIFLTNTLEKPHAMEERNLGGGFAQAVADESRNADKAKTELPVMVVLGNPPYSGHSANSIPWIDELMRGKDITKASTDGIDNTSNYFKVDGAGLNERN
nr:N-6 DNA methylase [Caldisericia bacterium]